MLIKDRHIVADSWTEVAEGENLPEGDIIVPLAVWQARRDELTQRNSKVGVRLEPENLPQEIAQDLDKLALVALNFPASKDGRIFSIAQILRQRYGYTGELRATGQYGRDQMFYLQRCGVNAFEIQEGRKAEDWLKSLDDFTITYQAAADQPLPLFRRR